MLSLWNHVDVTNGSISCWAEAAGIPFPVWAITWCVKDRMALSAAFDLPASNCLTAKSNLLSRRLTSFSFRFSCESCEDTSLTVLDVIPSCNWTCFNPSPSLAPMPLAFSAVPDVRSSEILACGGPGGPIAFALARNALRLMGYGPSAGGPLITLLPDIVYPPNVASTFVIGPSCTADGGRFLERIILWGTTIFVRIVGVCLHILDLWLGLIA